MDENGEEKKNINNIVDSFLKYSKDSHMLLTVHKQIQSGVKPTVYSGDIKKHVKKYMKDSGYAIEIQNKLLELILHRTFNFEFTEPYIEPILYIRKAQRNWERCIVKSINSMCSELSIPLSRKRNLREQEDLKSKFQSMSLGADFNDEAFGKLRPVYSSADFFEIVVSLKNSNNQAPSVTSFVNWGLMKIDLYSPSYKELQTKFFHLTGFMEQCGIRDDFNDSFTSNWKKVGDKVVSKNNVAAACEYLKQGCSNGLRKHLWLILFGLKVNDPERLYFEDLKNYVYIYDMLVDHLVMKDVRLTVTNDDSFFVFEDVLYQILLVFCRDKWLLKHFEGSSASPPQALLPGSPEMENENVIYPPSGIFPFHGFSMLAASLCFIFGDTVELYYAFRCLYARYFFRLHTLSSHPEGILSLCVLFENLLQEKEPVLAKHMVDIGAKPLQIVFNWLLFAFAGHLPAEQTLNLWDRILGYNSLLILPITSVAILSYRRENILAVEVPTAVEAILADISSIKIIPVLVHFLSGRHF